jgi:hypothetical protein
VFVERDWSVSVLPRRIVYAEKNDGGDGGWTVFGDERWGTLWVEGTWGKRWWRVAEDEDGDGDASKVLVYDRDRDGLLC